MRWGEPMHKRQFLHLVLALAAVFLLTGARPAQPMLGVSMSVTTTADEIRTNNNCSLREAVLAANTNKRVDRCPAGSSYDTIRLPAGTYYLKLSGKGEDQARTGDLDLRSNIQIIGASMTSTIIDAQEQDRVLDIPISGPSVRLSNLTLRNGYDDGGGVDAPDDSGYGGGIRNWGKLTLYKVRLLENMVTSPTDDSKGGGIYNYGSVTADQCRIEYNVGDWGGGVYTRGPFTFRNGYIRYNFASVIAGVGIGGSSTLLDNVKLIDNNASEYVDGSAAVLVSSAAALRLLNSVAQGGNVMALRSEGSLTVGGVSFRGTGGLRLVSGTASLMDISFYDLPGFNPAVLEVESASVTAERLTAARSQQRVVWMKGGSLTLRNSTLSDNRGPQAILVEGGSLSLEGVTIADNTVEERGLILTGGTLTMHNTILANSRSQLDGALVPDCLVAPGSTTSLGYNLLGNVDGCNWPIQSSDQHAVNTAHIDPMLGPLQNNGGFTNTRALLPGSTAIDRGDPASFLPEDQRGVARPQGPGSDIGAFELSSTAPQLQPSIEETLDGLLQELDEE